MSCIVLNYLMIDPDGEHLINLDGTSVKQKSSGTTLLDGFIVLRKENMQPEQHPLAIRNL